MHVQLKTVYSVLLTYALLCLSYLVDPARLVHDVALRLTMHRAQDGFDRRFPIVEAGVVQLAQQLELAQPWGHRMPDGIARLP